ncbi:SRPBCC family protein [Actinomarinicola tropica]|uniref:SRPBCC family protein n=1 Tax=Actinomarinicola tropica TaxID=2789776 RepID=A0A5Q2RL88_9ACTN|nr:SRPBCC family protein [Actinomarinicola tropica]QGG94620.1 hypothetical protein GH723_05580 [Actinomarinicola tropica]
MPSIRTSIRIPAPPARVWQELADISTHVEWMADAVAIRFTTDQQEGVGTTFECDTKVGPLRLVDVMEVTSWEDERRMGVRHVGLVTGTGEFTLTPAGADGGLTDLTWTESLVFPWYLGGPLGARVATPVLRRIWEGNLRRFARRI